jgi:hypothetical protein
MEEKTVEAVPDERPREEPDRLVAANSVLILHWPECKNAGHAGHAESSGSGAIARWPADCYFLPG